MKLAIIGSRNCPHIDIERYLDSEPDTIVSGGAKDADLAPENSPRHTISV